MDGHLDRRFRPVVERFARMFAEPGSGGGALAIRWHGEPVVDVWTGHADAAGREPWRPDTAAMSFSTTKGVASTVVHRLVERGELAYDDPLARHWPAFDAPGKRDLTLRALLTHRTGLHRLRGLVDHAEQLLDHEDMIARLGRAVPSPSHRGRPGYHGLTYGWLVAGLLRHVTGRSIDELVRREVAEPLGLDGCWVGTPRAEHGRVAELFPRLPAWLEPLARRAERSRRLRAVIDALVVDGIDEVLLGDPRRRVLSTQMPAANGVFTARSLATMYGALANDGEVDGVRLLRPGTVHELAQVQTRERDAVLGLPMRWRLGYHQAFTAGRGPVHGFGHFGFGGSGAWADPESGLSVAFVTNRLGTATTPVGDARLARLGALALRVTRRAA